MRITVEQPLKLRWEVTDETIEVTLSAKALQKQPDEVRDLLRALLVEHRGSTYETVAAAKAALGPRIRDVGLTGAAAQKVVWSGLAVRDEDASVVVDRKGAPEPDPELRDAENVPLPPVPITWDEDPSARLDSLEYRTAVEDYVREEVLPYVSDAWVDHGKTRIGYEIPLTRHFYKYAPPRPLEEIDAEIEMLEAEIQELLSEVTR